MAPSRALRKNIRTLAVPLRVSADRIKPAPPAPPAAEEFSESLLPQRWHVHAAVMGPVLAGASAWTGWMWMGLAPPAAVALGVLLLGAIYWITECVPVVATALLLVALVCVGLALPAELGWWARGQGQGAPRLWGSWTDALLPASSSVVVLLLGSLVLGAGVRSAGLDRLLGARLLRSGHPSPWRLVVTVALVSAWFSLWLSNTATAALMIAITRPLWAGSDRRMACAAVLAVAIGANVGGIATPVGTPPAIIAFGELAKRGVEISFFGWFLRGLPLAAVLLIICLLTLRRLVGPLQVWRPDPEHAAHAHAHDPGWTARRHVVAWVFVLTVGLWLTGPWTGVPVGVAALLPLAALPLLRAVTIADLRALDWDVLLLIIGGLVLGDAVERSGLAGALVQRLPAEALGPAMLAGGVTFLAAALSAVMSNTAVANLLCPLALALVASLPGDAAGAPERLIAVGFGVALGAGVGMPLAVSTPANALAFQTGAARARDFLVVGTVVSLAAAAAMALLTAIAPRF